MEKERTRAEEDRRRANEKADAAERATAERTRGKEALSSRFVTKVRAIGDPDKDIGELITNGIGPTALRRVVTELETQLRELEAVKDQLVALEGEVEANRWEQIMQNDARPKVKAALMCAEKNLNGKELIPTPRMTSSSINTGATKKEAVAFPRFKGAEKPARFGLRGQIARQRVAVTSR